MATRAIPKIDALECITKDGGAYDIATLRIENKELDLIQRQLTRADELTAQTSSATDYNTLVDINNNLALLVDGAAKRAETIQKFSDNGTPMAEINNSEQLLANIDNLSRLLSDRINELSGDYQTTSNAIFTELSTRVDQLQQAVNSGQTYSELLHSFSEIQNLLKPLEDGNTLGLIKDQAGSEQLIVQMNDLVDSFQSKAESVSGAFESSVIEQINTLVEQVSNLESGIGGLTSAEQVTTHSQNLEALNQAIKIKASEFNTIDEAQALIQKINEVSIAS